MWGGPSTPPYIPARIMLKRPVNTLGPRQNGRHFADDIFKCIFLNENVWISIKISLQFVPLGPIVDIPALVQIMAWCRAGDKPLSEPMMVRLPTHICVNELNNSLLTVCNKLCFVWFAGMFFIIPCMDTLVKTDLRTISFDVPPQEVSTVALARFKIIFITGHFCPGCHCGNYYHGNLPRLDTRR